MSERLIGPRRRYETTRDYDERWPLRQLKRGAWLMHGSHNRGECACCSRCWRVPLGFAFGVVFVEGRLEGRDRTTVKKWAFHRKICLRLVGGTGIEPVTPTMSR